MTNEIEDFPRPMTERERAILSFLLSVDALGVEALRVQAATAEVVGRCPCGCATINLRVDRAITPVSSIRTSPVIHAATPYSDDTAKLYELILFLDHGWLSSVEIVYYGDTPPTEFPLPSAFDAPWLRPA